MKLNNVKPGQEIVSPRLGKGFVTLVKVSIEPIVGVMFQDHGLVVGVLSTGEVGKNLQDDFEGELCFNPQDPSDYDLLLLQEVNTEFNGMLIPVNNLVEKEVDLEEVRDNWIANLFDRLK